MASNTSIASIEPTRIPPRSGTAFKLKKGQRLIVIDPEGIQVSDLLAFNAEDIHEVISSGRTLEYVDHRFVTG